ncbi:peptidase [Sporosarcina sp. NCCP-2222]|uniref:dipeptidase n=1 Tax=Sporosarcina sp. NCCP-2222 TaxID=2935073 RepID=UPI0020839E10|nr:membrane dipeptidase [Sporosarcina sp. NCCP-2222]GKV54746.1 peptidase [Sporosarcina sp. NCCP-2222]
MKVFDLHSDLFTDIAMRRSQGERRVFDRLHYPKLKKGHVDSVLCVIWVEREFRKTSLARFRFLYDHVMADLAESEHAAVCRTVYEMVNNTDTDQVKVYLGLEGLTFMEAWEGASVEERVTCAFHDLDQKGFHHAILAWNEHNFLASGTGADNGHDPKGLSPDGIAAIKEMERLNWLIDVSHMDETSFWDIERHVNGTLIASHSNARAICDHERNLTDNQMKAIAQKQGLIGLNAHYEFIDPEKPSLDRLVDHAVYISDLVGTEHLAFGFDFLDFLTPYDTTVGAGGKTTGFESALQVPDLLERMAKRGFTQQEIERISFGNAMEVLKRHMKK